MDILAKYEQEQPKIIRQTVLRQPLREDGLFVRLVVRFSRGKIQDSKHASYVLAVGAILAMLASILIGFVSLRRGTPTIVPSPIGDDPLPLR